MLTGAASGFRTLPRLEMYASKSFSGSMTTSRSGAVQVFIVAPRASSRSSVATVGSSPQMWTAPAFMFDATSAIFVGFPLTTRSGASYFSRSSASSSRSALATRASSASSPSVGFKPYELTMMFWALTRFGEEPSPELCLLFESQCARQLRFLKPQELSNVATAYGRVGRASPLVRRVARTPSILGVRGRRIRVRMFTCTMSSTSIMCDGALPPKRSRPTWCAFESAKHCSRAAHTSGV